ncbi:MAG TPA: hypothetical protein VND65_04870 [Candidatus Binatia bacterium]|nr:hypothetical protein [Candidatus Binatia bacterium]
MKTIFLCIVSCALLAVAAPAQDTAAPSAGSQTSQPQAQAPASPQQQMAPPAGEPSPANGQTSAGTKIAPGSVIPVALTRSLDAKKAKQGDEVLAKVTQDMKTNSGEVLVPKDTKVVGHVTEAQPRTKEQKESQLGISFDHAVMQNGSEVQLPMSIQAIIGSYNTGGGGPNGNGYDRPAGMSGGNSQPSAPGGRSGGMGGTPSQPAGGSSSMAGDAANSQQPAAPPQITGKTEGVIGIPNLELASNASDPAEGSVLSSDKSNVKLESGTMMLLRVK